MSNTNIWLLIGAAAWIASVWFAYSMGHLHGNTAGIKWATGIFSAADDPGLTENK